MTSGEGSSNLQVPGEITLTTSARRENISTLLLAQTSLPTAHVPLPTTHVPLPTTHVPLLTRRIDSPSTRAGPSNLSEIPAESSPEYTVFNVSNGYNRGGILKPTFSSEGIEKIRRKSLVFRRLIDEAIAPKTIDIIVDLESGLDNKAVESVLEALSRTELDVNTNPETVAIQCAALWHYQCDPASFANIRDSEELQVESSSPNVGQQNVGSRSQESNIESDPLSVNQQHDELIPWQGRTDPNSCRHLITIGLVLRRERILRDEIKLAVWETEAEVNVAQPLRELIDIKAARKVELKILFNKVKDWIREIEDDSDKKFAKSIKTTLMQNNLGNFSRGWEANIEKFEREGWTPFRFMREIKNALGPEPQTEDDESNESDDGKGLDVPSVDWKYLCIKLGRVIKRPRREIERSRQEKKESILRSLETHIDQRCEDIVEEKMTKRDRIVWKWQRRLSSNLINV